MNDDSKNVNQNNVSADQVDQAGQTQQSQSQAQSAVSSVSTKEQEPIGAPNSESAKSLETKPEVDEDTKEKKVEAEKNELETSDKDKKIISQLEKTASVPSAPTSSSDGIAVPMSKEEAADKLKTGQDDDSGKWYAALINKIIAVMVLRDK